MLRIRVFIQWIISLTRCLAEVNCSEEKFKALSIGALIILVTTTFPYLTLINALFFVGILFSGAAAAYYYIITCQIRFTLSEAFVFSGLAGIAGSFLSVMAGYILITVFNYRPGIEGLMLLSEWMKGMSPEQDAVVNQLQEILQAPVEMTFVDFLISLTITIFIYAPFAGLGGVITVWLMKRQAARAGK